jgi:hypothetical protein
MICHAKRIRHQLLAEIDNRAIKELEERAEPLTIMIVVCFVAMLVSVTLDAYAAHKHAGDIQTASIFAQCLSGTVIDTGEGIATCKIEEIKLVEGIK